MKRSGQGGQGGTATLGGEPAEGVELERKRVRQGHEQREGRRLAASLEVVDVSGRDTQRGSKLGLRQPQLGSAIGQGLTETHAHVSRATFPREMNNARERHDTKSGGEVQPMPVSAKRYPPLHEQLARIRRLSGLTQEVVAEIVGWKGNGTVSNVERGTKDTQLSEAEKWAEACGYELVAVPMSGADPEGLHAMIDAAENPLAISADAHRLEVLAQVPRRLRVRNGTRQPGRRG
jgi:transcriptional regulator with XRE-family HTH domain